MRHCILVATMLAAATFAAPSAPAETETQGQKPPAAERRKQMASRARQGHAWASDVNA